MCMSICMCSRVYECIHLIMSRYVVARIWYHAKHMSHLISTYYRCWRGNGYWWSTGAIYYSSTTVSWGNSNYFTGIGISSPSVSTITIFNDFIFWIDRVGLGIIKFLKRPKWFLVCIYICVRICVRTSERLHTYIHMLKYTYEYIYIYTHTYLYI